MLFPLPVYRIPAIIWRRRHDAAPDATPRISPLAVGLPLLGWTGLYLSSRRRT